MSLTGHWPDSTRWHFNGPSIELTFCTTHVENNILNALYILIIALKDVIYKSYVIEI